jgi:hypothetical protein
MAKQRRRHKREIRLFGASWILLDQHAPKRAARDDDGIRKKQKPTEGDDHGKTKRRI